MTAPDVPAATGLRGGVEALADEANARMRAYPDHPHLTAWSHYASDLRDLLAAHPEPDDDRLCDQCGMPLYRCTTLLERKGVFQCCDGCDHEPAAHPEPTPTGLVEVIQAHQPECSASGCEVCECGWNLGDQAGPFDARAAHAAHVAAEVSAWVRGQVVAELTKAADELLAGAHERAHAEVCRTQHRSDRTAAHVALDVAAEWLRTRAAIARTAP